MGASVSSDDEKKLLNQLKPEEIRSARKAYKDLQNDEEGNSDMDQHQFLDLFANDVEFAIKLWNLLPSHDFLAYLTMIHTLSKDTPFPSMKCFNGVKYNKIEAFSLILLEKTTCTSIHAVQITLQQFEHLVFHLFMIFPIKKIDKIMFSIVHRINKLFPKITRDNTISLANACKNIKEMFPAMNHILEVYFQNKFLFLQTFAPALTLNSQSTIIDTELLCLLYTNQLYNLSSDNLTLLHSSADQGMSLKTLLNNVLGYDSQTLIVFRSGKSVFGGFNNKPWKDQQQPQGDDQCFVFSLTPDFQIFDTSEGNGTSKSYAYCSSKSVKHHEKIKAGLGFGGNSQGTVYQLWLDEITHSNSYISKGSDCFSEGWVITKGAETAGFDGKSYMPIDAIEVWGFGNEDNLQNQIDRRNRQKYMSRNCNRINKTLFFQLLSDFDRQMFLSHTYSHQSQIRQDVMDHSEFEEDYFQNLHARNLVSPIVYEES